MTGQVVIGPDIDSPVVVSARWIRPFFRRLQTVHPLCISAGRLQAYRCLVIGAFPADAWTDGQMQAVVDFVSDGGAVIFLGGDHAFGRGGYADTPLQPLFPWVLRADEPEPVLAPLEAGLAPAVTLQGVIPGWADVMRAAHPLLIHSMNRPGRLRAGAIALMNAWHDGEQVPVIALQTYGRGRVMGIATDTLWRWRLAGGRQPHPGPPRGGGS